MIQMQLFPDPPAPVVPAEPNLVDTLLAVCACDARAVIEDLLADADFLRDQLYTASQMMSHGMGRGWRPRYERVVG